MASNKQVGFTLIELMIAVAVLTILVSIAIPAYNGYIKEAKLGTAKANMDTLRVFLEDTKLEDGSYVPGASSASASYANTAAITSAYKWSPDGDGGHYSYTVNASTNSYDISATHDSGVWLRCDDKMSNCCDGTGSVVASCP